jgi:hypothetical protein
MSIAEPPETRALDDETRLAAVQAVDAAKARGWTQDDLRAWFTGRGVSLENYLGAKAGGAVSREVRGVLAQISITGLPDRPRAGATQAGLPDQPARTFDDPYPDLPTAMKSAERWLLWRAEPNEDPAKKPRKVPCYVTGERRHGGLDQPEDVAQLASYEEACAALAFKAGYAGLGFALGPDGTGQHWQGIDLDNLDQHPGLKFVADDLPGYTEKSPSGGGVHAIGYGRPFVSLGSNTTGIEAYARGRFFTVTGESTGMGEITCLADFVDARLAPLHSYRPQDTSAHAQAGGGSLAGSLAAPDLRSALASMRADDRDLWIRMGHALRSLGDQGRGLWLEWSQTSDKYDPADASRTWDSFKPERTGYQAVFAEAQRGGWVNPAAGRPAQDVIDPETGEVLEEVDNAPQDPENRPIRASEFTGEPPGRRWVVEDWIVEGAVNSLYGDGGLGKTLLAQLLACAAAIGGKWLGLDVAKGATLAVLCEDEKDELHRRHNDIKAALGFTIGNPFEDVWLWPRVGDENVLIRWDKDDKPVLGSFMERLVAEVEVLNPALLILDTLADFYAGNEISRPHVNYFVKTVLGGLIKRQRVKGHPLTILLLGHPSVAGKASGSGYSGSTAWNNAVRSRMYLTRPEEGASDERILTRGKANYAKSGDETAIRLFYADGVLRACDDADDGDSILWAAREEVCKLVDRAWNAGRPYSAQKGHARYIYAALPADMASGGFAPQVTRQALRELIVDDATVTLAKGRDKRGYRTSRSGE